VLSSAYVRRTVQLDNIVVEEWRVTLTDFSVPDQLGTKEIRDKCFNAVGLPELT